MGADPPNVSVIMPAFNEERYLGPMLEAVNAAVERLRLERGMSAEVHVVDNASTDRTAAIAGELGATVHYEADHNIARARNLGAEKSRAPILVFVDADTLVPPHFLTRVVDEMADARFLAGAMDTEYRPERQTMRLYLGLWRVFGRLTRMAQGSAQFCRRDAFTAVGGYDETLFMGEDVDFFWRLQRHADATGAHTRIVRDLRVVPSARRFDRWPLWRVLLMTNPFVILLLRRRRRAWSGWYEQEVR
jgi:glycosyltransferase involved in cell wall biosynthesis